MSLKLTPIQRETLMALITLYREKGEAVRGEDIAAFIKRNPGTIRNQMQTMKALGLVDGVPGPKGGYRATIKAYEAMGIDLLPEEAIIKIRVNDKLIQDANVEEVSFTTIRHPNICKAEIQILGDMDLFKMGDRIIVGPTPVNKLIIKGIIEGKDTISSKILVDAEDIETLPKHPTKNFMTDFVVVEGNVMIKDVALKMKNEKLYAISVLEEGELRIVTINEVLAAILDGKSDDRVGSISKKAINVNSDDPLYRSIAKTLEEDPSTIAALVTKNDRKVGIINKITIIDRITDHIMDLLGGVVD